MFETDTDEISLALEQHRLEFPGLTNNVYFNFGGQGPLPRAGLEAIIDAYQFLQLQGPFSLRVNQRLAQRTELLRQELATELGCGPRSLVITENVTIGCNIVLWGIDWRKGDRILLTDCEHPGIIATVQEIARRFELTYDFCPIGATLNQGDPLEVIAQSLTPQTRLVVLSHLLWNTGQVLPLAEIVQIAHHYLGDRPIQVLVDGAQSVGSLPLQLETTQVDYYAFTGHKWLCGPAGVGGLYIHPDIFDSLHPTFIGWRGLDFNAQGEPQGWKPDGRRFEVATSAYPEYEGLRSAIAIHQDWASSKERYRLILQRSEYLWRSLTKINGIYCLKTSAPEAGLVSFQVTSGIAHESLVAQLEKQGFLLRKIASPNCVRACVHYFTLESEIDQLVETIRQLV
jgi:L-cysteine/cystine lyase